MKIYTPIILTLLFAFGKAESDELINDLKDQIEKLKYENTKLKTQNNLFIDKISRKNDIILAMTYKYDQLEKKAQAYYNSFQTQKRDREKIVTKYTEPVRSNTELPVRSNSIFPYLFAQKLNKEQMADRLEESKNNSLQNGNINSLDESSSSSFSSSNSENESKNIDRTTFDPEAPVARSMGSMNLGLRYKLDQNALNKLTLKSAYQSENNNNNNNKQTGSIPDLDLNSLTLSSGVKKSSSWPSSSSPFFARLRKKGYYKKHSQNAGFKRKRLSDAEANQVFKDINFSEHLDNALKGNSIGGIRK